MDDLDVSRLATCAMNADDIAELSEVIPLLFQRRNDGNDEQNNSTSNKNDAAGRGDGGRNDEQNNSASNENDAAGGRDGGRNDEQNNSASNENDAAG
jgi:hypothetical protein